MSLILSGTDGLSDVDGTAATPAIRGTDANTGIFFPAADTIGFAEGGVEAARIDASGNFGLGVTPSAWDTVVPAFQIGGAGGYIAAQGSAEVLRIGSNNFYNTSAFRYVINGSASRYDQTGGAHSWHTAASGTAGNAITFTQAMTLDASGNLGVGTTSTPTGSSASSRFITVAGSNDGVLQLTRTSATAGGGAIASAAGPGMLFYTHTGTVGSETYTERARIDSSGNLLVGATSSFNGTGCVLQATGSSANQVAAIKNTNANPFGYAIVYSAASPNGAGNEFIYCADSTQQKASIRSNGGLANYSANNVNLASDFRLKHNIDPVKSYWEVFKLIEWKTWLYNDQTDELKNIGVIAQELQALAPEFVCESNLKETPEGESPYLGLWENDLKMAGMSVITELVKRCEEQQALITTLTARITALESA